MMMSEGGEARNDQDDAARWYKRYREAMELMVDAQKERDRFKALAEQHENAWEAGHKAGRAMARSPQREDHEAERLLAEVNHMAHFIPPELADRVDAFLSRERSPQGEDPDGGFDSAAGETHSWPQGEDHDAGIEAAWRAFADCQNENVPVPESMRAAIDAYFLCLAGGSSTTEE